MVSITTDARATCNHSSMDGTSGTRESAADAAEAATAGTRIGRPHAGCQCHVENVVSIGGLGVRAVAPVAVTNGQHVFPARDNPFGEQKPLREFDIRARRAHGHGDHSAVDADLQRLLDNQRLRPGDGPIRAEMVCAPTRCYVPHEVISPLTRTAATVAGSTRIVIAFDAGVLDLAAV